MLFWYGCKNIYLRSNLILKLTSSYGIWEIPSLVMLSNPMKPWPASKGDWLLSDFLGTELICEARRLQSSWVNPAKDVPLGRTYLIYSWFFSIEPFCQDALGSQKKTFDSLSPFMAESSMLSGSENSVPLSELCLIRDNSDYTEENTMPKFL